jgi:transposase
MAKKWTPEDEKYLIKHYGKTPNPELAEHFGVSVKSIVNKVSSLRKAGHLPGEVPKSTKRKPRDARKKKETITPLSAITKKARTKPAKRKDDAPPQEPEGPPEYIPSTMMIMTEEGWKAIKVDKRKIKS